MTPQMEPLIAQSPMIPREDAACESSKHPSLRASGRRNAPPLCEAIQNRVHGAAGLLRRKSSSQ
jgi:hypothetical protein